MIDSKGWFGQRTFLLATSLVRARKARTGEDADPYLRSTREVIGYAVQAFDRAEGEVKDFLFDEQGWPIKLIRFQAGMSGSRPHPCWRLIGPGALSGSA